MKLWKTTTTVVLLTFVMVTVGMIVAQEIGQARGSASDSSPESAPIDTTAAPLEPVAESPATEQALPDPTEPAEQQSDEQPQPEPEESVKQCKVLAIYFHNTRRCTTCLKIESGARQVAESEFLEALDSGALRWSAVNMEEQPEYISRYGLTAPSLVLVRAVDDVEQEWIILDDTWSLVRSPDRFDAYIASSIASYLEACP